LNPPPIAATRRSDRAAADVHRGVDHTPKLLAESVLFRSEQAVGRVERGCRIGGIAGVQPRRV
jgi:hypothetical protein